MPNVRFNKDIHDAKWPRMICEQCWSVIRFIRMATEYAEKETDRWLTHLYADEYQGRNQVALQLQSFGVAVVQSRSRNLL